MQERVKEDLSPEEEKRMDEISEQASELTSGISENFSKTKEGVKEAYRVLDEKATPIKEGLAGSFERTSKLFEADPEEMAAREAANKEERRLATEKAAAVAKKERERRERVDRIKEGMLAKMEARGGVLGTLKKEYEYANEYMRRKMGPEKFRRRSEEDRDELLAKMEEGGVKFKHGNGDEQPEVEEKEEVDTEGMTDEELAEYELKVQAEEEEQARINATGLVAMGDEETVWEKRLGKMSEAVKQTAPVRKLRMMRRQAEVSDNPVISNLREVKYEVEDTLEDAKETYETSQHPLVWRVREANDAMFSETEQGWAIGEMQKLDAAFDSNLFLEDMEEYMIPVFVEAFMKPNMALLQSVTEEQAARVVFASAREREVQGHYWDTRILDIAHIDMIGALVEDGTPYVTLTFVAQHVHCVRDKKGKIVEGSETELKSMFYVWKVRRDFENPHFDWKITELGFQRLFALV